MEAAVDELCGVRRVVDGRLDRAGEQRRRPLGVRAEWDKRDVLLRIEAQRLERLARGDVRGAAGARDPDLLALEVGRGLDLGGGHEEIREDRSEDGGDRDLAAARGRRQRLGAADADDLDTAGKERGHPLGPAVDRLQVDGEAVFREDAGVHGRPDREAVAGEVRVGGLHADRRERRRGRPGGCGCGR